MRRQPLSYTKKTNRILLRTIILIVFASILVFMDKGLPARAGYVPNVINASISGVYHSGQSYYINGQSVLNATVEDYSTISVNNIQVFAEIYKNENYYRTIEMNKIDDDNFSLMLSFLEDGIYSFVLYAKDGYVIRSDNEFELNGGGNGFILDNRPPSISINVGKGTYFDGTDYYIGASASINGISVNIAVNDGISGNEAGISKLSISLNDTELDKDYSGNTIVKTFGDRIYEYGTVSVNTLQIQDYLNSLSVNSYRYNFYVASEDKLGNKSDRNVNLLMDVTKPQILNITIDGKDIRGDFDSFDHICDSPSMEIIVKTSDSASGGVGYESGVSKIYVKYIGTDGQVDECSYTVSNNEAVIRTPGSSFRGHVEIYAVDNVGNTGSTVGTKGIICEPQGKHDSEEHIVITMPDTVYRTKTGGLLYNGSAEIKVSVTDNYSGINSISVSSMTITACDDDLYATYSNMHDDNTGIFRAKENDKGLVTRAEGTFRVYTECNDITLFITIMDNAGNLSKKQINFSIDKTKPAIVTELINTESDEIYSQYYNSDQQVRITISDRNFDPAGVYLAICEGGDTVSVNGFAFKVVDDYGIETYEATVPFSDDGEYDIYINSYDLAGNICEGKRLEQFVIDKTAPVITVTYNDPEGIDNYYREDRILYLNIKEKNFTQYRVECIKDTACGYFTQFSEWKDTNIYHNSELTFDQTGTYSFEIEVTDMAGNVSTVDIPVFIVDLEKPEISFYGVEDGGTYAVEITPEIYVSDAYYDTDTLKISLTGVRTGYEGTFLTTSVNNKGESVSASTIPVSDLFSDNLDDVYTLSVSNTDKSGNEESATIYFAINCLGSIYELAEDTTQLNYSYIKGGNNITLTEINPDIINDEDINIVLYKDGVPTTLVMGADFIINKSEEDGEYKRYEYDINAECFDEDGVYELTVQSIDKAGNENNNLNEERNGFIRFAVDNTAPLIRVLNINSDTRYEDSEKTLEFYCFDKYKLDTVKVYVDNIETPVIYSEEKGVYELKLYESVDTRNIRIVATDYAGNTTEVELKNVMILQEWYIRFWNNHTLRYGAIAGIVLLILISIRVLLHVNGKWIFVKK